MPSTVKFRPALSRCSFRALAYRGKLTYGFVRIVHKFHVWLTHRYAKSTMFGESHCLNALMLGGKE